LRGREQGLQLQHVLREALGRRGEVAPERAGGERISAGRPAKAKIDPPGIERLQSAELLGDEQRAWFGSMMPPEPTLMVVVAAATTPMTTAVAALAIPAMLWCSASQ
jgi:hypothetical protein